MKNFILEQWDDFCAAALGHLPPEEKGMAKKFFFAGAAGLWRTIHENPELKTFDTILRELNEYNDTLERVAETRAMPQGKPPAVDAATIRKLEHLARSLARMLDDHAGGLFNRREVGFALFLFAFRGGELTYVSNAERADMLKMLTEFMNAADPQMTWDEQHG